MPDDDGGGGGGGGGGQFASEGGDVYPTGGESAGNGGFPWRKFSEWGKFDHN